ncbi:hypothetical protein HPP92_023749 [Vanilla planifolia]|nr:hypothetical protein HPP92_023749 [Vanilla planifolia]
MAANSRFDLSSSSPDGLNFCNGQRAPYGATTLEKSGSFREGLDRIFSSASGTSKANGISSQGEITSLVQSLALDLKGVVADQKSSRPGEIKRAVSSILGVPEDLSSTIITKQLPPMSMEEIKRLKSNLQEGSIKAR